MKSDFILCCTEDISVISEKVSMVAEQLTAYLKNPTKAGVLECEQTVEAVLDYWVSYTWVGSRKCTELENAFQKFFVVLCDVLVYLKDNTTLKKTQKKFGAALFRGKVYRYLGHDNPIEADSIIEPIYNGIYVSWSKNEKSSYIESKLYGTKTLMSCLIQEPFWGIDLEALGISRGNEREVVFPTIESCITEIKYLNPEEVPNE